MSISHVGGFLGAGKTTLLALAALRLRARNLAAGLITNDQAPGLVDTAHLESETDRIGEVAGSCFCCDFGALEREVRRLHEGGAQVVLAEAVGSCTDLVATVLRPMQERLATEFRVAPLTVVTDPRRLTRVVFNSRRANLHESAAYIYVKQLEEAEIILLNKIDTIDARERASLLVQLEACFPAARVLAVSAARGDGIDTWLDLVTTHRHAAPQTMEVDYDRYAEGEAVLGWLNANVELASGADQDWNAWLAGLLRRLQQTLPSDAPVGHVKALLASSGAHVVANWVEREEVYELRGQVEPSKTASLILNARVEAAPEELERLARDAMAHDADVHATIAELRCLRPARPVPSYRSLTRAGADHA